MACANWHIYFSLGLIVTFTLIGCGKATNNGSLQSASTALLTISESPAYDYGIRDVGTSWDHTFAITNSGSAVATEISSSFYLSLNFGFKDGSFPGTGGDCPAQLNPQDSCNVVVTFTPRFSGPSQATLSVSYNNGVSSVTANGPVVSGQGN